MDTIVKSLPNWESIDLIPSNTISRSDIHIEIDYDKKDSRLICIFNILILWEPATVVPWQYTNPIIEKFNLVIAMGEAKGSNLETDNWAHHPYEFKTFLCDEKLRKREAVMINSAKFSANSNSLYGFRRKVSRGLSELDIDYVLIGDNWHMSKFKEFRERVWALRKELLAGNRPNIKEVYSDFFYKYPEYTGRVDDKIDELSKYKYAIVIENEADFVSEKLFDAIAAKCVPIYVGPNLKKYKNLSKCIIPFESNLTEIVNFFKSNNDKLYSEKKSYIDNSDHYIDDLNEFSFENTSKKIATIVNSFLVSHGIN
jgi:hypothetical protein